MVHLLSTAAHVNLPRALTQARFRAIQTRWVLLFRVEAFAEPARPENTTRTDPLETEISTNVYPGVDIADFAKEEI